MIMQTIYGPQMNLPSFAPVPPNHENGIANTAYGLFPPPSVFEVVEQAEVALRRKATEAEELRSSLEKSRQENEALRSQLAKLEVSRAATTPQAEGHEEIDAESNSNRQVQVQPSQQSEGVAYKQDVSVPPIRASSPVRQNAETEDARKQSMVLSSATQEELRTRLVEAQLKEAQMLQEIRSLEWRLSDLRAAYEQQQQIHTEAASKALSYRQELVDENLKHTYDLQVLEQERSVYFTSLLRLLAEYGLQPAAADAQSIVSAIKALVKHLSDKHNERRGYQRPWHVYSPSPPRSVQSPNSNGRSLELVPKIPQRPPSPPSPMNNFPTRDIFHHQDLSMPNHMEDPAGNYMEEDVREDRDARRPTFLPSLPEEPNHAASEDGDPLPGVAGLRIVGDAVLGGKLTVCGHSINGTNLCNFQWNRYYPDGNMVDIDGASRTEYIVSADDCETLIAIQCCPMDERGRKGEQVTEFANSQNLIKCDQTMEDQVNSHIDAGRAYFDVQVLVEGSELEEDWQPGTLVLKRSHYVIMRNNVRVIRESYSENINVRVVLGREIAGQFVLSQQIQCLITSSDGTSHYLAFGENRVRDRAVLTLRRFRNETLQNRKSGKKSWFSKKTG